MNAKARTFFIFLMLLFVQAVFSEDVTNSILSWQKNFARSSLGAKVEIIKDAVTLDQAPSYGPLYDQALSFVLEHEHLLGEDPLVYKLISSTAEGLAKTTYSQALPKLWSIFMTWRDTGVRAPVLLALGKLGRGDSQIISNINQFLSVQNNAFASGVDIDILLIESSIDALGSLNSASSFPVLFSAMVSDYPENIKSKASAALRSLDGEYKKNLLEVILKNPAHEKLAALKEGLHNTNLKIDATGELAETALDIALSKMEPGTEDYKVYIEICNLSVGEIKNQKWNRATPLLIRYYHLLQNPSDASKIDINRLVQVIQALGAMGDSRAAQVLSLSLGLLNAEMERSKSYDPLLLTSTIEALGELGDKISFDYLLYIGYLPYPDDIKILARTALNRLKW
jgi:hypothetical protein